MSIAVANVGSRCCKALWISCAGICIIGVLSLAGLSLMVVSQVLDGSGTDSFQVAEILLLFVIGVVAAVGGWWGTWLAVVIGERFEEAAE